MGWLISINNKLIMFSLSVSTLLFATLILFYHVKPRFHVNDLLRNRIREKRIRRYLITELKRINQVLFEIFQLSTFTGNEAHCGTGFWQTSQDENFYMTVFNPNTTRHVKQDIQKKHKLNR